MVLLSKLIEITTKMPKIHHMKYNLDLNLPPGHII